jgi:Ca2+-binding EF-hand superfamily protein
LNYEQDDFDAFYRKVDLTEDGLVSRAEMRNFLEKLGRMEPPKELEAQMGENAIKYQE